ncbi:MAG: glycosyltransferase family 4 protein [Candidatus Paceibacterota bacterium]|jgi:glycosyltransferase involved in cell wall biosynthesis
MTIHFFTFSDERGGSSRQRAFRIAEELHKRGISVVIQKPPVLFISNTPWPRKFLLIAQLIRSLFLIKKGDIVYLQRAIANKYFFAIMVVYLKLFHRKMIFDFDDPVYVHTPFKTRIFTQMADAVVVCTHGQKEWALKYNPNVHIFHIVVDFHAYQKFTKEYGKEQSPTTIGWVGTGPEHVRNLEILSRVFNRLVKKTEAPFKFVLIGSLGNQKVYSLFQNIPGLRVEFIDELDWKNPESVPREIQKFDIGVLPHRSDGEWNQNKTSLKILEYMACGVPVVVSAFGEMPYIIQDGVNGYLAGTDDEWVKKLEKLLSDSALRARLGRAGQKTVQDAYSHDVLMPKYIDLIESLKR